MVPLVYKLLSARDGIALAKSHPFPETHLVPRGSHLLFGQPQAGKPPPLKWVVNVAQMSSPTLSAICANLQH